MNIIYGIIAALFDSISDSLWKKAIDFSTLSKSLFNFIGPLFGSLFVYILIFFVGINTEIFFDYKIILIIFSISILKLIGNNIEIGIYERVKLSDLLPYSNLDKIFIVIIGFIIFYGTENSTSLISFLITLFTIFVIVMFSIDIKKIHFSTDIIKYFFVKFLTAIKSLLIGYILIEYTTLDYLSLSVITFLLISILFVFIDKSNFIELFKQKKDFYKYRFLDILMGRTSSAIGLYIIQLSGILIATLLSFISLVFSILSIKIILGENPTKKQIILALIVMLLIGIGYYFK